MDIRPDSRASPWNILHIPLELVDIIIDHLFEDKPSLASCSLVSREWRPSTRYHLFESICVCGDGLFGGYDSFLRFLDETPSIRPFIRCLTLSGVGKSKDSGAERCLIGPYVLLTVLDRLTALRTLVLDEVVWGGASKKSSKGFWRVAWPPVPRPFNTLQLRRVESYDLGPSQYTKSVFQILQAFGALQKLDIVGIEFDAMSWNNVARLDTPSALAMKGLSMRNVSTSQAFVAGVRRTQTVHSLLSMNLQCKSMADAHSYGSLIRDAGDNLEDLELDIRRLTRQVATCKPPTPNFLNQISFRLRFLASVSDTIRSLNIPSCIALKSLHIRVCIHPEWGAPDDLRSGWSYIGSVLQSLPPSAQSILFTLTPPSESHEDASEVGLDHFFRHLSTTNWNKVALALERCKGLREVKFDMQSNITTRRLLKEVIVKRLPVMEALGVLQFT